MPNHYQTLKVAEDAPPEVIKAAYRVLSQQHHPDSNPADQQAEAVSAMQAINAAYEVLIEPAGRTTYDEGLRVERAAAANGGNSSSALVAPDPVTTAGSGGDAGTGRSLVPSQDVSTGEHRRRRRSSSSRSHSRSSGSALAEPLYRSSSGSRSLTKTDRSMAPLFSSAQSTTIHGRRMHAADEEADGRGGLGRDAPRRSGRGVRLLWLALVGIVMAMLLLGGLVAWKLGYVGRFWSWFQRRQAMEASRGLMYGSASDMVPPPSGIDERPYTRPALTPHGRDWPTSTSYLPGAPVLWNDGACQITVDNTLHDSDVHAKIVAMPTADGSVGSGQTTVREAYIQRGTRMSFEALRPGMYQLRYRALLTGIIVRAATVELTQSADVNAFAPAVTLGSAAGTAVMVSLYKVAPGNSQRPVLEEAGF